jgi:hypothetical protein
MVPLVVGVVLIVPPQVYYALRANYQNPGSFWQFLDRFFDVRLAFDFPSIIRGAGPDRLFEVAHLWFLYYLLVYSLLLVPAFLHLRRDSGRRLLAWLGARCRGALGVLILAVPVVAVEAGLGTGGFGGWNRYSYIPFLLYGFLISADRGLSEAIRRSWRRGLVIGIAVLPVLFVISHYEIGGADRELGTDYDLWSVVWRLLKATGGWAWAVAIFGLVTSLVQHLPKRETPPATMVGEPTVPTGAAADPGRVTRYVGEAVLPFYVLHQTAIVVIGFYVVQWEIGALSKYLTISFASLAATLLVYDLCVRRTNITRVLFGMRRMETQAIPAERPVAADRR